MQRLSILAPAADLYDSVRVDAKEYLARLRDVQRLRNTAFAAHGMTADHMDEYASDDEQCLHIVMTNDEGSATACVRCLDQPNTVDVTELRAYAPEWPADMVAAVASDLGEARRAGFLYGEWGSFVVDASRRGTTEALVVALASYALGRLRGGALGLTLANVKYGAASILRRISADETVLPGYFDSRYYADVELVRFDSRRPASKYERMVAQLQARLATVPVLCG